MPTDARRRTVLVTAAGGGAGNNLIRNLRDCRPELRIVGTNIDRFFVARSLADSTYLVPRADSGAAYIESIRRIVAREDVDLIVPMNDAEVGPLGLHRAELDAKTLLPSDETIALCQDKYALHRSLEARDVPVAETRAVQEIEDVDAIFAAFGAPERLWCRMRRGSASKGALPVSTPEQARFWIRYWQEMRGVSPDVFLLSRYLPGRDFAFQSLWFDGEPVMAMTCERLEYLCGEWMPSGTSSTPRVGRLVKEPRVTQTCLRAVREIDAGATGMFCIDLKEDRDGVPCITEINIGRFFMISPVFHAAGRHRMADLYVRLAFGEPVDVADDERIDDIGDSATFLVRELDQEPAVLSEEEIEARTLLP